MRIGLLLLIACVEVPIPETPSYATDIQPLLEIHCVRCHTSAGRWDGGVELDTYQSARSTRVRSTCTAVEPSYAETHADALTATNAEPTDGPCFPWGMASMPPGATPHLSLAEQETLIRWIETGAQP